MRSRRTAIGRIGISLAAAAALLGPVAAGAAAPESSGETLTVWIMEGTNPDPEPFVDEVAAAFEAETGATLDLQFVQWAEAKDRFTTAIAGGTLPDVAELGTTWTPEYADAGVLLDVTQQVEETGLMEDFVPALVEAGTVDGALYGMPWYAGVRSIVYRTDIFEAAGITELPTDWDGLVEVGNAIAEADPDIIPWPIAGDNQFGVASFIWGAGGDVATQGEDGTWTSGLTSPEAREGIAFYTGLATEHGFSTAAASTWNELALRDSFTAGDAAMMISGNWTIGAIVAANPELEGKLGAFPIPAKDGGVGPSFLGGSHLSIFNTTENEDLAWQFVELMTTGDVARMWSDQSGFFPGTLPLLEEVIAADDPLVAPFAEQMAEGGRVLPVTPLWGQIEGNQTMAAMMQSILSGDATVEEATEVAAQEMNDVFASG
jgi:N,N'-diacetylchitobiose transport system substrate-binding protein